MHNSLASCHGTRKTNERQKYVSEIKWRLNELPRAVSGTPITDVSPIMIPDIMRDVAVGQCSTVAGFVDQKNHSVLKFYIHIEN